MSRKLTGRFEVGSVLAVDASHWTVQGSFFDETGTFGPGDIATGLRVFLYSPTDNTLRYKVTTVNSNSSNPVEVILEWDTEGSPIEPPANVGGIAEVSTSLFLPEEPSFSQQLLDEPLVAGIRSQTNRDILDTVSTGGGGSSNIKSMIAFGSVTAGKPVSKRTDGKSSLSDSDGANDQVFIGIALTSASDGGAFNVQLMGPNLAGVLTGLGFTAGSDIYMSETAGGYTDDPGSFTGGNDSILRLGIADCAAGIGSGTATDLILFPEVIARPE